MSFSIKGILSFSYIPLLFSNAFVFRTGTIGPLFLSAAEELGYDIIDTNGASQAGFGVPQVNIN